MRTLPILARAVLAGGAVVALAACGDDGGTVTGPAAAGTPAPAAAGRVVVTTSILGDVVTAIVGDDAEVEVIMPAGSDPHDFAPSARQAAAMRDADLLVVNGLGFEEGLVSAIEGAARDGVPVHEATSSVATIGLGARGHDHGHDDGQGRGSDDPHFFTDPSRMADAVEGIGEALARNLDPLDTDAFRARVAGYVEELRELDTEVEAILAGVPAERRVLITNHAVFGYFADRYGFEVLGAVIPGGTTLAEPSAADLADLAAAVAAEGVPAVFVESSAPTRLAQALASEVGHDVALVELFTESLGPAGSGGETYLDVVRTNAERIAEALA